MANTIDELRAECPELVSQIQSAAGAEAVQAEQQRLREIDEVSALFDAEMVNEAKYGEHACDARELAYRAAQAAAKQGRSFLASADADASAAADVPAATPTDDDKPQSAEAMTPEQRMNAARATVAEVLKKSKEGN